MIIQRCSTIRRRAALLGAAIAAGSLIAHAAAPPARSPNLADPAILANPGEDLVSREFPLNHIRTELARIALLGTLLALPPHRLEFKIDADKNSFTLTDTPDRIRQISEILPVIDQPIEEHDMQRRLMQIWVRIVDYYSKRPHA
jgi:hypothetical protein